MEFKNFDNERDARIFRESKRDEGHAASLFVYGKDKYRIEVVECTTKEEQSKAQRWLSNNAWDVSQDVEDLTKIKELITNPDWNYELEDMVFIAKKLNKEHWFKFPEDTIRFFDGPTEEELGKIKELIDEALKEHDDGWNEYAVVKDKV